MNIVSVNINQFLGKKSWTEKNINFQEETTKYMPKVIGYLKNNIRSENDIVICNRKKIPVYILNDIFDKINPVVKAAL